MAQSAYSLLFDGSDDLVYTGFSSILNGATAFSLSIWIKPSGSGHAFGRICEAGDDADPALFYLLNNGSATAFSMVLKNVTLSGTLTASAWQHVAARWDGSTAKLYVAGSQVDSQSVSGSLTMSGKRVFLGNNESQNRQFAGYLDDVALWASDIGATEIANIASGTTDAATLSPVLFLRLEEGTGTTTTDSGSGGNNGTLASGPTWSSDVSSILSAGAAGQPTVKRFGGVQFGPGFCQGVSGMKGW